MKIKKKKKKIWRLRRKSSKSKLSKSIYLQLSLVSISRQTDLSLYQLM